MVVLHEPIGDTEVGQHVLAVGLLKPPAGIAVDAGFEHDDAGEARGE